MVRGGIGLECVKVKIGFMGSIGQFLEKPGGGPIIWIGLGLVELVEWASGVNWASGVLGWERVRLACMWRF